MSNHDDIARRLAQFSLVDALLARRSRRFGMGMHLDGGPLEYQSKAGLAPVTLEEEAALVFAAVGITGIPLAEMNFTSGGCDAGGGNIIAGFAGRTAPSGDAIQSVGMVVINDEGTWYVRRPQEIEAQALPDLVELARNREFVAVYEYLRVQLSKSRVTIPARMPYTPPFNRWDSNAQGTTFFLPILEASELYINILLSAFSEELGVYIVDDVKKNLVPAGIGFFAQSRGGHLHDDSTEIGFATTISIFETMVMQLISVELGAVVQNLSLMAEALGLGGFVHAAVHPEWLTQLGFSFPVDIDPDSRNPTFAQTMGFDEVKQDLLKMLGYDPEVPTAVALEHPESRGRDLRPEARQWLMRAYCPPNYGTIQEAVMEFVERKYAFQRGIYRNPRVQTPWKDAARVQSGIQEYSGKAIQATLDYCEYIWNHFARFPSISAPISTLVAYQAHRIDSGFYERFYADGAPR